MGLMIAAMMLAGSTLPAIEVEAVPGRGFSASVAATFDAPDMAAITAEIAAAAKQKCGARSVRFGRYRMDNAIDPERNVPTIANYRQSFSCYDPASDPYEAVPDDWTASAEETAAATAFAQRFLDQFAANDAAAGIAMMDPLIEVTEAEWQGLRRDVTQLHSGGGDLTAEFRGWLNNPEGAAYPGAYAYFAVMDSDPAIVGTCGGILVQRVRPKAYRLSQYDVQYVTLAFVEQQGLDDDQLDQLCQR